MGLGNQLGALPVMNAKDLRWGYVVALGALVLFSVVGLTVQAGCSGISSSSASLNEAVSFSPAAASTILQFLSL